MNSRLNCLRNHGIFSRIDGDLCSVSNHFYLYFYLHFLGWHILQINILAINRCIHTGDTKGRGRRWPEWVPRRRNSWGKHFPQTSILPNIIDGEGCLGGHKAMWSGGKNWFPQMGILLDRIWWQGAPWGSSGVPHDGKKMNFPMIATSQAPELVGDANQSIRGDLPSILVDPLTISQSIFTGFLNPQKPRRDLWNEWHKLWTNLWNIWPSQETTQSCGVNAQISMDKLHIWITSWVSTTVSDPGETVLILEDPRNMHLG